MLSVFKYISDFFYQTYQYREYLKQSVLRDLRTKYKRSALGYIWTMLHPLAMMLILSVVFSHIMRLGVKDYAIFLFAGLLPWNYFNSTCLMSLHTIRHNARLFGQVPVPKYIFVLSIAASNGVNLALSIVPLLIIMALLGHPFSWTLILFPIALIPLVFLTVGLSLILATSNVFFDDTLHLSEVGLQALYFLSPILYYREALPAWLTPYVVILNPMFTLIESIRSVVYSGQIPDLCTFGLVSLASFTVLTAGLLIFKSQENKFLYFI